KLFLRRRKEDLEIVLRQQRLFIEQREKAVVVLDAVNGVVLRDRAVHQQPIQPAVILVLMAQSESRADKPRHDAIMDATQSVDVDGDVVSFPAQVTEKRQRSQRTLLDQILLVNGVEVRIAPQQILRAGRQDAGV